MSFDITSTNSRVVLTCDLFTAQLQQFSADTSYEGEEDTVAETRMSIDGKMVAGQTPSVKPVTIHLEASSPSLQYMYLLKQSMEKNHKPYPCQLVISQPSVGRRTIYSNGCLVSAKDLADGKKLLDPTTWKFNFESKSVETL